ncbi:MAG: class I SAM-dependent methyltransferase [bacterium]|nr:class I SAM-dependent methyltransferase [bacterium]
MKKILRFLKRRLNKIFGTLSDELFWRFRHFFDRRWALSYLSNDSLNHPHRRLLIEKISVYTPFETVLEIGCASGPNLYLLANKFPEAKLYGQDISSAAIYAGQKWLKSQEIKNVFLTIGEFGNLKKFENIDIVFTDAALIYIGPDKIETVINELFRIARKSIILCEWHYEVEKPFYADNWVYNYRNLFEKFVPTECIKVTKILPEVWQGNWAKYGYIIEVTL